MYSQKYQRLSPGKKRLLRRKFMAMFGYCKMSFYRKIDNKQPLRPVETDFFNQNLLTNDQTIQS